MCCYFELNMIFIYMSQQVLPDVTGMFYLSQIAQSLQKHTSIWAIHFHLSNHFEMFTVCRIIIDLLVKYVITKI